MTEPQRGASPSSRRSPGIAALLSFILPGLGHVYAGRSLRGGIWYLASLALVVVGGALVAPLGSLWLIFPATGAVPHLAAPVDAYLVARAAKPTEHPPTSALIVVLFGLVFFAAGRVAGFVTKTLFVESFKLPAAGMRPTLDVGDHFFADKAALRGRAPTRGEIVVFDFPENRSQTFIKRVVGLPGDVVELKDGHLYIDGQAVSRCEVGPLKNDGQDYTVYVEFLGDTAHLIQVMPPTIAGMTQGPWTVAPDTYFVMGDNRDNSYDSRSWFGGQGGGVPRDHLVGAARTIFWSPTSSRSGIDAQVLDPEAVPALAREIRDCLKRGPLPPRR